MIIQTFPRSFLIDKVKKGHIDFSKTNIISINTACSFYKEWNDELPEMQELFKGTDAKVLFLKFDDITDEQFNKSNIKDKLTLMSNEDAENIVNFIIETFEDGKDLIVHCTAGVSRSAAVSIFANHFVNKFLSKNEEDFNFNEINGHARTPCPNPYVSAMLNRIVYSKYEQIN